MAKKNKNKNLDFSQKYIKRSYRRLIRWYIKRKWLTLYKVNLRKMTYKKARAFLNKHFLWFDFWSNYKKSK